MLVKSKLNRRAFLKGAGSICIGLPVIEEFVGEAAYAQNTKLYNYVTCFFGMGIRREVQSISDPVYDPIRKWYDNDQLTVLQLSMPDFYLDAGGGNHEGTLPHVTIGVPEHSDKVAGGPSLDYVISTMTDAKPPIDIASCGNTVLNVNDKVEFNRSYRGPDQEVVPTRNPQSFMEELFGAYQPPTQVGGGGENGIIVDAVVEDYKYLMSDRAGLSGEARSVISDTLDEVLQVQRTINSTLTAPEFRDFYNSLDKSQWGAGVANAEIATDPVGEFRQRQGQGDNHDRAWVVPLLTDIFVLGLKLGQIRFGSIALCAGAERATFGPYGGDMHEWFHRNRTGDVSVQTKWFINNFMKDNAYLLQQLEKEQHLDGTLLDYTAVLLCTELERHHEVRDMWWAVAGGPFRHTKQRVGNGSRYDTDLYNTIAHAVLREEMPSAYNPNQAKIFGDDRSFDGLISEILT